MTDAIRPRRIRIAQEVREHAARTYRRACRDTSCPQYGELFHEQHTASTHPAGCTDVSHEDCGFPVPEDVDLSRPAIGGRHAGPYAQDDETGTGYVGKHADVNEWFWR